MPAACIKYKVVLLVLTCLVLFSFLPADTPHKIRYKFPYKTAGLTENQAAAHLLSRFTYGATPGQIKTVVSTGLEAWFEQQLDASLPDDSLNLRLSGYETLQLSNTDVVNTFPRGPQVLRMAINDGVIDKDSVNKSDKKEYKDQLAAYMLQKGFKSQQELSRQFINQKILRAAFTSNQLQEVLTDFWFNHFNVSMTKNDCVSFIPAYERDVIRPHVMGKFEDLLIATAQSPAMLYYLDNFNSSAEKTTENPRALARKAAVQGNRKPSDPDSATMIMAEPATPRKKAGGLNENYAREVMELHTLGVDGGYTQQDVTMAARVLTGWTVYPLSRYGNSSVLGKVIDRIGEDKLAERGFVHKGDFLFVASRHDTQTKTVLNHVFPAGGGYEEGVKLLHMLAHHQSTARFISRKIAVRFVSDNPPQPLIDRMVKTFLEKDGDIRQVLITMVSSPEFWQKQSLREKTKSPFELAISTVRSLNADIKQPYQLYNWVSKMGQKMYYYQAPTGFPDRGQFWINTGSLLNRMNFGLALASQRIPGISFNLLALNSNHEPESAEAALLSYSKLFMPERNLDETIRRLTPLLNDPELVQKVDAAAGKTLPHADVTNAEMMADETMTGTLKKKKVQEQKQASVNGQLALSKPNSSMLSQVVGIIIGSPEYQRR